MPANKEIDRAVDKEGTVSHLVALYTVQGAPELIAGNMMNIRDPLFVELILFLLVNMPYDSSVIFECMSAHRRPNDCKL